MEYVLSIIGLPQYSLKRVLAPLGLLAEHIYDHFIPHARNNYHPHILSHRSLALMSGLLVTVKIFTLSVLSLGAVMPAFSSAISTENIIVLTNQSRTQYGLNALKENSILDKAAQAKADDMLAKGYFSHTTPEGNTPWSFIVSAGYSYIMAGENLAVNFTEAENVEDAWMNSPGHKANILNKNFEEIGIGIAQGEYQNHTAIFVVQMFGTPSEQQIALSETPTKVQVSAVPAPAATKTATPAAIKEVAAAQPQTLGESKANPAAQAPEIVPVAVVSGDVKLSGNTVNITAHTQGPVVRAVAYFGDEAVMLAPKDNGEWQGQVQLNELAQKQASVHIRVYGMQDQTAQLQLADFSSDTQENYNLAGTTPASYVNFFGHTFDPKSMEKNFYLIFIAGLLSSLILAIAIKRHIQHVNLIANTSFVAILATLILWAG
ncbi:MAG: hypothetical protein HY918_03840 [Candidatus Doudnabacteria bacterium]|nr:hypothetical protein [Candidatus Doudnabacteria bacterium]